MADFEKKVIKLDVLVLGDMTVGKTALISRFIFDTFETNYYPTFGIDFLTKMIYRPDNVLRVQFWDSAGRKCFDSLLPSYIRDSRLVLVAYDVSRRPSYEVALDHVERVRQEHGDDVFIMLVGNKCDVCTAERQISTSEGQAKAKEIGVAFCETSAQSAIGVKAAFNQILTAGMNSLTNESMKEQEEKKAAEEQEKQDALCANLVLPDIPSGDALGNQYGCGCSVVWNCVASFVKSTVYGAQVQQRNDTVVQEA
ncbi:ras-related protein Rab6-like [Sycon ciliatum]|uniref:ras-related protein Rab6-like n=1 Tax=Sycon ciliatum TaxID=27933 RepID=UPI0020AD8A0F|eukprot:scpid74416/ scgid14730/ Ras-related protein Rab-6